MTETPVQLIIAAFNDEKAADQALKDLKAARREKIIRIQDAAVIRRDAKNRLHIHETGDMGPRKGALIGGTTGAIVGLLAGPGALIVGAAGALVGGLAARLRDSGFPDARLKEIGAALKPGTSAIVAVIEHRWVQELEEELARAGAQVLTEAIQSDIVAQLEAGRDVAYTALAATGSLSVERVTSDESGVEIDGFILTDEGAVVSQLSLSVEEAESGTPDEAAASADEPAKPAE